MLRKVRIVTAQAHLFRSGLYNFARRILVGIMATGAGELALCLPPAFAVLERRDLIRDQQIVRHGILYGAESRMALQAWLHLLCNR